MRYGVMTKRPSDFFFVELWSLFSLCLFFALAEGSTRFFFFDKLVEIFYFPRYLAIHMNCVVSVGWPEKYNFDVRKIEINFVLPMLCHANNPSFLYPGSIWFPNITLAQQVFIECPTSPLLHFDEVGYKTRI